MVLYDIITARVPSSRKLGRNKVVVSGTGNRTLGSAELISQVMRARNVSHYTIPDADLLICRLAIEL
ncbi:hypothetical protein HZ326_30913 [Fusarium oxysporum f. sp. albedinis]|nr:hypothetical protein HZ326_30913 [Fusarium oxysporum f. sp. albedinis]